MVMVAFKNNEFNNTIKTLEKYKKTLLQFYKEIFELQDDSELQKMLLSGIITKIEDYKKDITETLSEQQELQKTRFPETTPMFQIFEDTKKKMMEELERCQQISKKYSEQLKEVQIKLQEFYNKYGKKTVFGLYNFHLIQKYFRENNLDISLLLENLLLENDNVLQMASDESRKLDKQLLFVLDKIAATELLDVDAITRLAVYYENGLFVDKNLPIANTLYESVRFFKAREFNTASEVIKPYISKNDIFKKMYITCLLKIADQSEKEKKYEIAIKCYQKILELDSANEYIKTKLTDSYKKLAKYYYELAKSNEDSNTKFSFECCIQLKTNKFLEPNKCIFLESDKCIDILYMMANFYKNGIKDYLQKNFNEAINCYLQILKYNKDDSEALYSIANCYEQQKNNPNALKYYIQYIQKITSIENENYSNISQIDFCIYFYNDHKELFQLTEQKMLIAYCFSRMIEYHDANKQSNTAVLTSGDKKELCENLKKLLDTIPTEKLPDEEQKKYNEYQKQIPEQNSAEESDSGDDSNSDKEEFEVGDRVRQQKPRISSQEEVIVLEY